jgi:hypothetical protein
MGWGRGRREAGHEEIQEVLMRELSGTITWLQAADILGLEPRSVRRWRARYEAGGAVALYDRRTLRPSRRKAPALEVQRILRREPFAGWNVRHFYRFARRDSRRDAVVQLRQARAAGGRLGAQRPGPRPASAPPRAPPVFR